METKRPDRRVQRTRNVLILGAKEVMQKKGFAGTTIQDIADRANVNRATFYAHFIDKYALVDVIVRERFQQLLSDRLPHDSKWDRETLYLLIKLVIEFYGDCRLEVSISQLIEPVIYEELNKILINWLRQQQKKTIINRQVSIETTAQVLCWVILGAANRWSQEKNQESPEQMANDLLAILMEGIGATYIVL